MVTPFFPITNFPLCVSHRSALLDLDTAKCKTWKEKIRYASFKPLKIQLCYCETSLLQKENRTGFLEGSHFRDFSAEYFCLLKLRFFVNVL